MRISHFIILFISIGCSSCIEHNMHSTENDDVYFTKKDIYPIKENKLNEEIKVK